MMRDYVVTARHKDTGLWHALLFVNHPTPSGLDRPILKLSTTKGCETEQGALDLMVSGLRPEFLKTVDVPDLTTQEAT